MKKAAFAAVVVLAVVALSGSNLLSQAAPESVTGRSNGGGFGNIRGGYEDASEEELLRSRLRKLIELNAKTMSADELREAIGLIERFGVEPEFAPIIEQLQAILQKHDAPKYANEATELAMSPEEANRRRLKAESAIQLLRTQDIQVLMEVQNALRNRPR